MVVRAAQQRRSFAALGPPAPPLRCHLLCQRRHCMSGKRSAKEQLTKDANHSDDEEVRRLARFFSSSRLSLAALRHHSLSFNALRSCDCGLAVSALLERLISDHRPLFRLAASSLGNRSTKKHYLDASKQLFDCAWPSA